MDDKEPIYDAQIAPLMTEIIRVCKEHQIPMVASFQLNEGDDCEEGSLFCTTAILPEGCDEKLVEAKRVLHDSRVTFMALTITSKQEGD
jgi:hypothetical protein